MYLPSRRCVGCRKVRPKSEMIRVVLTADGPQADPGAVKPGRGCYVCRNAQCVKTAVEKNGFARSFRTGVSKEALSRLSAELDKYIL